MTTGYIELRAAATVQSVSFPARTIEIAAIPYGQATDRAVDATGRTITEMIAPHAFAAEMTRPAKRPVYREHDYARQVGRVVELIDTDTELRAVLKIASGDAGDEALDWSADGQLDPSLGFVSTPAQLRWSTDRRSRTVMAGQVAHVGLVAEPAYTGARVLAVRATPAVTGRPVAGGRVPTPNLDAVRLAALTARYRPLPERRT